MNLISLHFEMKSYMTFTQGSCALREWLFVIIKYDGVFI